MAVVGSGAMFSDQFLDKEDNNKIKDVIFDFLTSDNFRLNEIDADDPEISDYNMVPVSPAFYTLILFYLDFYNNSIFVVYICLCYKML